MVKLLLVLGVVLIVMVWIGRGVSKVLTTTGATFSAQVYNFAQLPNNYVRVYFRVTNTSSVAGSPSCVIQIQPVNQYGDYLSGQGVDGMTGSQSVAPGATRGFYMDVVVSNNDARFVTSKSMISVTDC